MHSITSFVIVVFWTIGNCLANDIILKVDPFEQDVQARDNVTLVCYWKSSLSNCIWKQDDEHVQLKSRFVFERRAEYCSLTIVDVQYEDEGKWTCEIDNITPLSFQHVWLSVNETEPSIRVIVVQPQKQYVVMENETILKCGFSAPSPQCFWSFNGDIVVIRGRYSYIGDRSKGNCSIKIVKAQLFDDGVWQCGYPRSDSDELLASQPANVTVVVMPSEPLIAVNGIKMKNGSKLYISAALQSSYRISCWSENGSPAAELQWGIQSGSVPAELLSTQSTDYKTKVYDNTAKTPLKIAHLLFPNSLVKTQWNQRYLICRASHPSYEKSHDVSVHLIIGYKQPSYNYYG